MAQKRVVVLTCDLCHDEVEEVADLKLKSPRKKQKQFDLCLSCKDELLDWLREQANAN